MAFSETQKAGIRKVMCAPKRFLVQYGMWWDKFPLEDAMDQVGEDPEASALIVGALADIDAIDAQLFDNAGLGFVSKADDFNLNVSKGQADLRLVGKQKIRTIANILGLDPLDDYFAPPKTASRREFV